MRDVVARLRLLIARYGGMELSVFDAEDQLSLNAHLELYIYSRSDKWLYLLEGRGLEERTRLRNSINIAGALLKLVLIAFLLEGVARGMVYETRLQFVPGLYLLLRVDALALANPWVVEADGDLPPPAAVARRYRQRLCSVDGWRRVLTGDFDLAKAARGVRSLLKPRDLGLAATVAASAASSGVHSASR